MAGKAAPSGRRIFLLLVIVMALIVGVQLVFAYKKLNSPTAEGSQYSAAIGEHDAASPDGRMTNDQRTQFVKELKAERMRETIQALTDAKKVRNAASFGRKLEGLWRMIPDKKGRSYELQAGLLNLDDEQYLIYLRRLNETAPWDYTPYKIVSAESADLIQAETRNGTRMMKIQPCRQIVTGHTFVDCLSFFDGAYFEGAPPTEVAYRDGDSSEDELADLKDAKSSLLQQLSRYGGDHVFR